MTLNSSITFDDAAVVNSIRDFIVDTNSKAPQVLNAAAEPLLRAARDKAPVSKKGTISGKYTHPPGTLKKSIVVGRIYRTKYSVSVAVGIANNQYFTQAPTNMWYARWVEFGTGERVVNNWWGRKGVRHTAGVMPATPFMRPAVVQTRNQIKNYVRYRLQEELFGA